MGHPRDSVHTQLEVPAGLMFRVPFTTLEHSRIAVPAHAVRLSEADRREIGFWSGDERYNRNSGLWDHLSIKLAELDAFRALLPLLDVRASARVLELGAGQAWASALVKHSAPSAEVHASELSSEALMGAAHWEQLLGVQLDGLWAFPADQLPFEDGQFDRVFAFAAFHHFAIGGRAVAALEQTLRLVRPGGRLVLLCEPVSPAALRGWHRARLNRIREATGSDVEEEVLVYSELARAARTLGFEPSIRYNAHLRPPQQSVASETRDLLVRLVPALGRLTPIGAHLTFERAAR